MFMTDNERIIIATKAGVSWFFDSEVRNSSFVHPMNFNAKNPTLRQAANRYKPF
jgi:hypothetical protein